MWQSPSLGVGDTMLYSIFNVIAVPVLATHLHISGLVYSKLYTGSVTSLKCHILAAEREVFLLHRRGWARWWPVHILYAEL